MPDCVWAFDGDPVCFWFDDGLVCWFEGELDWAWVGEVPAAGVCEALVPEVDDCPAAFWSVEAGAWVCAEFPDEGFVCVELDEGVEPCSRCAGEFELEGD